MIMKFVFHKISKINWKLIEHYEDAKNGNSSIVNLFPNVIIFNTVDCIRIGLFDSDK